MGCADFHVQVRIAHGVADLFKRTSRRKHRKRAGKRDHPGSRHTGSDADHVAFCDAAVHMAFRICFLKGAGFGCRSKVGVEHDHVREIRITFYQSVAVAVSGCNFLYISHRLALQFLRAAH